MTRNRGWLGTILAMVPLVGVASLLAPEPAPARAAPLIQFADPAQYKLDRTWIGSDLGLPEQLGGMLFSEDGKTLYIVAAAEDRESAIYAVPVTREKKTEKVIGLGPADAVKIVVQGDPDRPGIDAGLAYGPDHTIFYTYYSPPGSRQPLAQRRGFDGEEVVHEIADFTFVGGLRSALSGLVFPPRKIKRSGGSDDLLVSFWGSQTIYSLGLKHKAKGIFEPVSGVPWVTLPEADRFSLGGLAFVPRKATQDRDDLIFVGFDSATLKLLDVDRDTVLPIDSVTGKPTLGTDKPVVSVFATGPAGWSPWSLTFDRRSGDLFVDTWGNRPTDLIQQISGFDRK